MKISFDVVCIRIELSLFQFIIEFKIYVCFAHRKRTFSIKMGFKTFRRIRIAFQILGFERSSCCKRFENLIFVAYVVAGFLQFLFIRIFWRKILYTLDDLGWVSDEFKFGSIFSTYFMSIYVSWKHKQKIDQI